MTNLDMHHLARSYGLAELTARRRYPDLAARECQDCQDSTFRTSAMTRTHGPGRFMVLDAPDGPAAFGHRYLITWVPYGRQIPDGMTVILDTRPPITTGDPIRLDGFGPDAGASLVGAFVKADGPDFILAFGMEYVTAETPGIPFRRSDGKDRVRAGLDSGYRIPADVLARLQVENPVQDTDGTKDPVDAGAGRLGTVPPDDPGRAAMLPGYVVFDTDGKG